MVHERVISAGALLLAFAFVGSPTWGQTEDNTVPAAPHYWAVIHGDQQEGVGEGYRFPIRSSLLQPGVLRTEGTPVFASKWMTQSIALVGDDAGSRQWLALHLDRLRSLGAVVIVVSAASAESFKELQRQVAGLPIVPDASRWMQGRLLQANAAVYPLFIGTDGLARQHIFTLGSSDEKAQP